MVRKLVRRAGRRRLLWIGLLAFAGLGILLIPSGGGAVPFTNNDDFTARSRQGGTETRAIAVGGACTTGGTTGTASNVEVQADGGSGPGNVGSGSSLANKIVVQSARKGNATIATITEFDVWTALSDTSLPCTGFDTWTYRPQRQTNTNTGTPTSLAICYYRSNQSACTASP